MKSIVISLIGESQWKIQFSNVQNIVKLLLDSSWFDGLKGKGGREPVERVTIDLSTNFTQKDC